MKKMLIVFLVLVLLLAGLFFWKGGHHAMVVSQALEEWLDADHADQTLSLHFQRPGFNIDSSTNQFKPKVDQWSLTADTFWTEYADDEVFGLTAGGITAYLRQGILYMDTGRAYSLPDLSKQSAQAARLAAGLLLHGRVTKDGDTYHLAMDTEELQLSASVTMDRTIRLITISVVPEDGTSIYAQLIPKDPQPHPIPQAVKDSMVLTRMERPISLSEPLEVLLPALNQLLPLSGDLKLGISSGILELSETVGLSIDGETASIIREGIILDLDLPSDLSALSPTVIAAMLLRDGEMNQTGTRTQFSMTLPGDTTAVLLESLIPQTAGLGIRMEQSSLTLVVEEGRLTSAELSAEGSVPFLLASIPVTFSANLTIS